MLLRSARNGFKGFPDGTENSTENKGEIMNNRSLQIRMIKLKDDSDIRTTPESNSENGNTLRVSLPLNTLTNSRKKEKENGSLSVNASPPLQLPLVISQPSNLNSNNEKAFNGNIRTETSESHPPPLSPVVLIPQPSNINELNESLIIPPNLSPQNGNILTGNSTHGEKIPQTEDLTSNPQIKNVTHESIVQEMKKYLIDHQQEEVDDECNAAATALCNLLVTHLRRLPLAKIMEAEIELMRLVHRFRNSA